MYYYFITFRSITGAQRAEKTLERSSIGTSLLRTPKNMVTEGCGYALKIKGEQAAAAAKILRASNVGFSKVFILSDSGYKEVVI